MARARLQRTNRSECWGREWKEYSRGEEQAQARPQKVENSWTEVVSMVSK